MKGSVSKVGLDWIAYCSEHRWTIWCEVWEDAMSAICGHLCMTHSDSGKTVVVEGAIK